MTKEDQIAMASLAATVEEVTIEMSRLRTENALLRELVQPDKTENAGQSDTSFMIENLNERVRRLEQRRVITRRDLFAAAAMAALIARNVDKWDVDEHASVAKVCAEALITALDAPKP